jgi:hypothetical protein
VIARVLGWIVLGVGLSFALAIGALAHLIFPAGVVGLAIGGPIAVLSLLVGVLLLRGGKRLDASGASTAKNAQEQAILALAAHQGGSLTAQDASRGLDISSAAAEALLQTMAKEDYEKVAVDVDANGTLVYRFSVPTRLRVQTGGETAVDPEVARSPNRAEWERLEAEEAQRSAGSGRARANR